MSPRAFVSHNGADKRIAEAVARGLRELDVDAWFDKWEIAAGDALVPKVFEDGIADCSLFVVLVSAASLQSKWVREELNAAFIQKIEGTTRVVVVKLDASPMPPQLAALRWLNYAKMTHQEVVDELARVAHGMEHPEKPALGVGPPKAQVRLPGLSDDASRVAIYFGKTLDNPSGHPVDVVWEDMVAALGLSGKRLRLALEALAACGTMNIAAASSAVEGILMARPTFELADLLDDTGVLDFSISRDGLALCAALIASNGEHYVAVARISEQLPFSHARVNLALEWAKSRGLLDYAHAMGVGTLLFGWVRENHNTRSFVEDNS